MKTTPKALKGLYTALGGSSPIADESKTVDVLNAISTKIGGDGGASKIPDAIDNIAAKADTLVVPTGKLSITGTAEVDCSAYAKAQVSSETLLAENIKKDVNILGVTGSYEGGGGSSDFSTAEVTLNLTMPEGIVADEEALVYCTIQYPNNETRYMMEYCPASQHKATILLYDGVGTFAVPIANSNGTTYQPEDPSLVSLSGNVVYDSQNQYFVVSGECTVSATLVALA